MAGDNWLAAYVVAITYSDSLTVHTNLHVARSRAASAFISSLIARLISKYKQKLLHSVKKVSKGIRVFFFF